MTPNGDYTDEKIYADKFYIDNKEVLYPDRYVQDKYVDSDVKFVTGDSKLVSSDVKYVNSDIKYVNSIPDTKYVVDGKEILTEKYAYQSYEHVTYQEGNGYIDRQDKKTSLKIKLK